MKHYTEAKGTERAAFRRPAWEGNKRSRTARSASKNGYRRRERAALKELLRSKVAEWAA